MLSVTHRFSSSLAAKEYVGEHYAMLEDDPNHHMLAMRRELDDG